MLHAPLHQSLVAVVVVTRAFLSAFSCVLLCTLLCFLALDRSMLQIPTLVNLYLCATLMDTSFSESHMIVSCGVQKLKVNEIRHGRLAKTAFLGMIWQAYITREGPWKNLQDFLSDPGRHNIFTEWPSNATDMSL